MESTKYILQYNVFHEPKEMKVFEWSSQPFIEKGRITAPIDYG